MRKGGIEDREWGKRKDEDNTAERTAESKYHNDSIVCSVEEKVYADSSAKAREKPRKKEERKEESGRELKKRAKKSKLAEKKKKGKRKNGEPTTLSEGEM